MNQLSPPLLTIVKSGRAKYYALTETGRRYVEQAILPNQASKIRSFTAFSLESSKFDESMQLLRHFREAAGTNWDITLIELLSDTFPADSDTVHTLFSAFTENVIWFKIHHKDEPLQKIYNALEQEVLKKMLERYVDQCLKNYYILEPVFQLEKTSVEDAFAIIDDMFDTFDLSAGESGSAAQKLLTEAQYYAIFHHLRIMMKTFCQYHFNKKDVIEDWKMVYHTINPTLLYIAEKCCSTHKLQEHKKV